jgi:hypothetical protein
MNAGGIAKPFTLPASREKTFHRATEPLPGGSYRRKINRPTLSSVDTLTRR